MLRSNEPSQHANSKCRTLITPKALITCLFMHMHVKIQFNQPNTLATQIKLKINIKGMNYTCCSYQLFGWIVAPPTATNLLDSSYIQTTPSTIQLNILTAQLHTNNPKTQYRGMVAFLSLQTNKRRAATTQPTNPKLCRSPAYATLVINQQ